MKKPELNTNAIKIDKLINRIDEGVIKIPAFQRGYVWKQNQILELLESIVKQYPISSVLLWEATEKEKLKSTRNIAGYMIPDCKESWPVNYVLDGQQRISSIYAVFSDRIEQEESSDKYNPDLDIFEIYYNFKSEMFVPKNEIDLSSKHVVALRNIVDPIKLIDELSNIKSEYREKAKQLSSIFLNYEVPVVEIKNRTKEDVGVIFERINNTGTKLNTLDLMTAWTWTEDFHLLDEIDNLKDDLEEKGFGLLDSKLVLQMIAGIIIGSTKTENILRLTGERVRDNWGMVRNAVLATIDFLSTQLNCSSIELLPHHQPLIAFARFYSKTNRVTDDQIRTLRSFFWRTAFSNRYSTGRTTAKMDEDIEFIDNVLDFDYAQLNRYTTTVNFKQLIETQFSKANPVTRSFLLLSAQYQPLDLANGAKVDLGSSLASFNRKQYHHVFPNSFLTKQSEPKGRRFSVLNFCFLPADSNKKISSKSPSLYFESVVPGNNRDRILESNLLPGDMGIYENDDFDAFLKARAELVLGRVDSIIHA